MKRDNLFSFDLFLYFFTFFNCSAGQNNLRKNAINYQEFNEGRMNEFAAGLQQLNKTWKFEIGTCAEKIPLEKYGIIHNKCVDDDLMIKLFPHDKILMDFLQIHTNPME